MCIYGDVMFGLTMVVILKRKKKTHTLKKKQKKNTQPTLQNSNGDGHHGKGLISKSTHWCVELQTSVG